MTGFALSSWCVWLIASLATFGVITRLWHVPQAAWAVGGALALCVTGLLPWSAAQAAVGKGDDVYLFLIGMMLAAELARHEGLFDFLAAAAARRAAGSASRLFLLIYGVGIAVTVLMSNDATVVVLTPAVLAVMRTVKVDKPLPYLYICAFIANAASFVLPISNPANLVIFHSNLPPLGAWLARFALPSLCSIVLTYVVLRFTQRASLREALPASVELPVLSPEARLTGYGIGGMAVVMLSASALGIDLGLPTFMAGVALYLVLCLRRRQWMRQPLGAMSWGVLPLVAGLFVLVEGLQHTGVIDLLAHTLHDMAQRAPGQAMWGAGIAFALLGNAINNLPAGLIAGAAAATAHVDTLVSSGMLIGVDLGPNLSISGSLATILWLTALRREGIHVSAWAFMKLGSVVMFPALIAALMALLLPSFF